MDIDYILERLTDGFRPFSVRTSDGREYAVPHPEFIAVGKHSVAVIDKRGYAVSLDPRHIVALKDLPAKRAA